MARHFSSALLGLCLLTEPAQADFTLTILHTNDVHSRFNLIDQQGSDCSPIQNAEGACFVAYARLATAIREARERDPVAILIDAGDQFPTPRNPSPPETGRPLTADLMNRLGYDAMTLGNHETDDGPEVLAAFVSALSFPALTANEAVLSEPELDDLLGTATVLEVGGERVGIVGVGALGMNRPEISVQETADTLRTQGINKIIVLSHLGFESDKGLADRVEGIDIIVGGHTHTYLANTVAAEKLGRTYPTWVNGVAIVHAYQFGTYLGELHATFDDEGALKGATGMPIPMGDVADDEVVRALIEKATSAITQ